MHTDLEIKAGVIEGFFGKPWGWSARLSSANFLRDAGYQFYIYAPKSESFLRRRWREPIPAQTLEHLRELRAQCQQSHIEFGIGLTPFEIYLDYDTAAQVLLRSKVLQINEVGADILCILFDDMRGDVKGLSDLQARVISDVCAWSNAESFIVCPTYYSYDSRLTREFGPPPKTYSQDLGRIVDPVSISFGPVRRSFPMGIRPSIWQASRPTSVASPSFGITIFRMIRRRERTIYFWTRQSVHATCRRVWWLVSPSIR